MTHGNGLQHSKTSFRQTTPEFCLNNNFPHPTHRANSICTRIRIQIDLQDRDRPRSMTINHTRRRARTKPNNQSRSRVQTLAPVPATPINQNRSRIKTFILILATPINRSRSRVLTCTTIPKNCTWHQVPHTPPLQWGPPQFRLWSNSEGLIQLWVAIVRGVRGAAANPDPGQEYSTRSRSPNTRWWISVF